MITFDTGRPPDAVFVSERIWQEIEDAGLFARIISEGRIAEIDIPGCKYPMQVFKSVFIPDSQDTLYGATIPDKYLDLFHKS